MDRASIFATLKSEIATRFEVDENAIHEDSLFVNDLDADSLDLLELVVALRELFSIEVNDGEVKALLAELARFLPDENLGQGDLSDDDLIEVTEKLRVRTFIDFIDERMGAVR